MSVFVLLLEKLIPLYVTMAIGFAVAKYARVSKESVAGLLFYVLIPSVVFAGVATTPITLQVLALPLAAFIIGTILSWSFYYIAGFFWRDATRNILAFTSGMGNVGYLGIPVALAAFGPSALSAIVLITLGLIFYENTLGFYHVARSHYSVKDSIWRLVRLPAIYAFIAGIAVSMIGIHFSESVISILDSFRSAYSVLGIMMVGIGLAGIAGHRFDFKFISLAFVAKFVAWPLMVFLLILIDKTLLHLFTPMMHQVLILVSAMPLAANTVVFATELKAEPEKAAAAVLASTVFALVYIPFIITVFIR